MIRPAFRNRAGVCPGSLSLPLVEPTKAIEDLILDKFAWRYWSAPLYLKGSDSSRLHNSHKLSGTGWIISADTT
jgi:hypothetical protein